MKNNSIEFEKGFQPNEIPSLVIWVKNNKSGMILTEVLI